MLEITMAVPSDAVAIAATYDELFAHEAVTKPWSNWQAQVYPTRSTVNKGISLKDMYRIEKDGLLAGSFRMNQDQPDEYAQQPWKYPADPNQVLVVHTLCIRPACSGQGIARQVLDYACDYGRKNGCRVFRIDTYLGNLPAAHLYESYGFRLAGIGKAVLNGAIHEDQRFYEFQL